MVRVYINSGVNAYILPGGEQLPSMPIAMATWVATHVGRVWPLFAPAVGALGAFIAGSNTVSNLMFSLFQLGVATQLAINGAMVVALQAVGAAAGNMIAIHNVVAASATVGLLGQEGATLRKTIINPRRFDHVSGISTHHPPGNFRCIHSACSVSVSRLSSMGVIAPVGDIIQGYKDS